MVLISCVLFLHLGLGDEIEKRLHIKCILLECPKCLSFWSILIVSLFYFDVIRAIFNAFVCAYLALWLDIALSYVSKIYNRLYEEINTESDESSEDSMP